MPRVRYELGMPLTPLEGVPDAGGADCVACGRCCHHEPQTVQLRALDEDRMPESILETYTEVMRKPPFFRFVKNDGERCAGLERGVPDSYPCRLYDVRPDGCRIVKPGSPACMEARKLGHLGFSVVFDRPARAH